jgi:hypothetical protein
MHLLDRSTSVLPTASRFIIHTKAILGLILGQNIPLHMDLIKLFSDVHFDIISASLSIYVKLSFPLVKSNTGTGVDKPGGFQEV